MCIICRQGRYSEGYLKYNLSGEPADFVDEWGINNDDASQVNSCSMANSPIRFKKRNADPKESTL